jgi:hypothetical protein
MNDDEAIDRFEADLEACRRTERRLLWKELLALAVVALIVVVRALWLS